MCQYLYLRHDTFAGNSKPDHTGQFRKFEGVYFVAELIIRDEIFWLRVNPFLTCQCPQKYSKGMVAE